VNHRLALCGGRPGLFTRGALDALARHSQGVPRVINVLCDLALVYAFAEQHETVSAAIVEDVVKEKAAHGLFWLDRELVRA
jgi:type II secretory pathway predicted ATPase ExeA